jgi:uncharacterized membrane protein YeaQ/YmgE (transglycosylase-associated protein family)
MPNPQQLIVWLVVGALAGNLVGRLVTFKKAGLGRWTNLGVGMVGALIGGLIFQVLGAFGVKMEPLANITFTLKDLVAAFFGSLLFIVIWWLVAKIRAKKQHGKQS